MLLNIVTAVSAEFFSLLLLNDFGLTWLRRAAADFFGTSGAPLPTTKIDQRSAADTLTYMISVTVYGSRN